MPEKHLERLPDQPEQDRDTLDIIAERLRTKGSVTLRDIDNRLSQQREKKPNEP
jgi:DNA-binding ferritin-like protein